MERISLTVTVYINIINILYESIFELENICFLL